MKTTENTNYTFEPGDRVTITGDIKTGAHGYLKELLAKNGDGSADDDLWVVVIKETDGCMSEDHFYSRNLSIGWLTPSNTMNDPLLKEFQTAVTVVAGGTENLEDYKFFAPDTTNADNLLRQATAMLKNEGKPLRDGI